MEDDASAYPRYLSGTPFALPESMADSQEHNNLAARVRTLEALLNRFAYAQERDLQQLDKRMRESHTTWESGVSKIALGIRETHENLYHPTTGAFVRLDRLEQALHAQSKFKAWLVGFVSSGALLIAGALLAKLFGTK